MEKYTKLPTLPVASSRARRSRKVSLGTLLALRKT